MAEYPGALDCFVDASRVFIGQNTPKAIVLHCTGSPDPNQTAQQLGAYFNTTPLMTSVHYGIDRQGVLCQYVLEADGAGGNCCVEAGYDPFWDQFPGNRNLWTISIECENDVTNSMLLTAAQIAVLFPLVAHLMQKHGIPLSNVKGHFSLEPTNRAECPGPLFPWTALTTYLSGGNSMNTPPLGWTYNATTGVLTATNGHTARLGNAKFILAFPGGWNPKNVPLEEEHGAPGGGTQQLYQDCLIAWDATTGVHIAPLGMQYQVIQSQVTQLQAQLASATSTAISQVATQATATLTQMQQHINLVSADIVAALTEIKSITPPSS